MPDTPDVPHTPGMPRGVDMRGGVPHTPHTPHTPWTLVEGSGPLVAVALHSGHQLRREVVERMALSDGRRLQEEDPHTGRWTEIAPTRVVVHRSRFELDLNRPRSEAVYRRPEEAWGLEVWKTPGPGNLVESSLALHDRFYADMRQLIDERIDREGRVLVLDVHSYNHRREGPGAREDEAERNPEVNIGTGTMLDGRWGPLVERFMDELSSYDFLGRHLDVRENVRFRGGYFSRWVHETYPESACALAIEVKKFFMDEWTGVPDIAQLDEVGRALAAAIPAALEELERVPACR